MRITFRFLFRRLYGCSMQNQLPTDYQNFIHKSRYARWREEDARRATWVETVTRDFDYVEEHLRDQHGDQITTPLPMSLETIRLLGSARSENIDVLINNKLNVI